MVTTKIVSWTNDRNEKVFIATCNFPRQSTYGSASDMGAKSGLNFMGTYKGRGSCCVVGSFPLHSSVAVVCDEPDGALIGIYMGWGGCC